MKVFKFGGASVKDAEGFRNVAKIIENHRSPKGQIVVVSAMGKTTNALESVIQKYFSEEDYNPLLLQLKEQQIKIVHELFGENSVAEESVALYHNDLASFLRRNKSPNYNYVYDQVICFGELISSFILNAYCNQQGHNALLLDARDYIKTDASYREGNVNWASTKKNIEQLNSQKLFITQGFIASDGNHFTTTLGREGSDYTAAIFAYVLNAESVTIWKDVSGFLNADPRYFKDAQQLNQISYKEAIELAYYGASVIHPKTLQPLQRKEIPLHVRSFIKPEGKGTTITKGQRISPELPCYILKKEQQMLTMASKDFSFATEDLLQKVFALLRDLKIKVNLMQTSAMAITLVLEDKYGEIKNLSSQLEDDFDLEWERDVLLYTSRHFTEESDKVMVENRKTLLRQISGRTLQIVTSQ